MVRRQRADANRVAINLDEVEFLDAPDVYDYAGCGESEFQNRHEAVAAGENFAIVSMLCNKLQSFINGRRREVFKICWDHGLPLSFTTKSTKNTKKAKTSLCGLRVLRGE